jgi:hypothetical protein
MAAVGSRNGAAGREVVARRFDAAGAALGDAFVVAATPSTESPLPDVAFDATGNLYVVWSDANDNPSTSNPPPARACL